MRARLLLVFGILVCSGLLLAATAGGGKHKHNKLWGDDEESVSISFRGDDEDGVTDCSDLKVSFDGEEGLRSEEELQVPATGTLSVDLEHHGGLRVYGTTGSAYTVRLCKAISPARQSSAAQMFREIRLSVEGNRLTVAGPSGRSWVGYLLIGAPRGAALSAESRNAPISLDSVSGNFSATALNGPVSVKDSSGVISAATTNGPISFAGSEGEVKLSAVNGPLSVKLSGDQWQGRGLTAETRNGPLSVALSDSFRSAVEISGGNGPWSCKGEVCQGVARFDDDFRSMTIGSGEPLVRVSTQNGPVSIKSR